MQPEDVEFRRELDRITASGEDQMSAIRILRNRCDHSISLVKTDSDGPHGYNCFMYALGLEVLPARLQALAYRFDDAFPNARFMLKLVRDRLQEIPAGEAQDGDIIVYFDGNELPKHAGVLQSGAIVSKWGLGQLWRHAVFDVPSSYGMVVRYFRRLERERVLACFEEFLDQQFG